MVPSFAFVCQESALPFIPSTRLLPDWLTATPIAHRGLHALPAGVPENSLAAFAASVAAGFPIELDVRLLADGQVVVFHDHDLARLTSALGVITAQTAISIGELRLLNTAERIPLLTDVLELVAGQVGLLIEIKADPASDSVGLLEDATLQALSDYRGTFAVQSFRAATVAYLAAHTPLVIRGQLSSGADDWADGPEAAGPDFVAYNIEALPTPLSSRLRARGVPLLAWTVRTPGQRKKVREEADNFIFESIRP